VQLHEDLTHGRHVKGRLHERFYRREVIATTNLPCKLPAIPVAAIKLQPKHARNFVQSCRQNRPCKRPFREQLKSLEIKYNRLYKELKNFNIFFKYLDINISHIRE